VAQALLEKHKAFAGHFFAEGKGELKEGQFNGESPREGKSPDY
jgi:hypothetical protein